MKIEFVTSANKLYFDRYGIRLARSAMECLPRNVTLRMYCEASKEGISLDAYKVDTGGGRIEKIDLFAVTSLTDYLNKARPIVEQKMGCTISENPEERRAKNRYHYEWDALTFGKKGFSLGHALRTTKCDYLFWVDADIVFFRRLTERVLTRLFRGRADVVYFGRKSCHSETGFIGFNMTRGACHEFAERYCAQWEELHIFRNSKGWTDCHAFDTVLHEMTTEEKIKTHNLSWTDRGHVMAESPLAMYCDHMKGDRKRNGGSPERIRYGLRRITEPFRFWLWRFGILG